jgi:hypothetical protein
LVLWFPDKSGFTPAVRKGPAVVCFVRPHEGYEVFSHFSFNIGLCVHLGAPDASGGADIRRYSGN